jgi:HEAT repeat protein
LNRKIITFALLQACILFGLIWFIAGNDRLFRSAVPIEQRLVSRDDSIRKRAQQELLGLDADRKRHVVTQLIPSLEQDDAFVRKWAAISLALVGPAAQEAIPALLQEVSDRQQDVGQAARVALSEIGAPDAQQLPSLLRTLGNPRESVLCEAAISIGKMGPAADQAVPTLLDFVRRPTPTPSCLEDALASLEVSVPEVLPPVQELLGNKEAAVRRKASNILSQITMKSPDQASPLLSALAVEQDIEVRKSLEKALSLPNTDASGTDPVLIFALRRSHSEVVRLTALDMLRHETHLPNHPESLWGEGLQDESATVRRGIAGWIRETIPRESKPYALVMAMLRDPDTSIRRLGLETLRRCNLHSTELMSRVAKAQRDPDAGVRCRASETLIETGSTDRVSIALLIGDLRKDEDTARCAEDVLGLAGLFDPDVASSMTRLVQDDKDPDIRSRAAMVLMHLGPRARAAIPALLRAQKDEVPGAAMALKAIRASVSKRRS